MKEETDDALQPITNAVVETLVRNHREFRSFLARRLSSEAAAEEVLQQALLRAVESQHSLKDQGKIVPWFYQILRNALIDYYRAHASESRKHERFLNELASTAPTSAAADEVRSAVCACFEALLPSLKPAYAELIRRIDLQGEPPASVAKALGVTPNNLGVRLHRARQALGKSLERSCGTCTRHGCLDCTCHESPP